MSENNGSASGSVDYSNMYVYAGPKQPSVSNMTVYASEKFRVGSWPVQANIIGSSHYIAMSGVPYRELTSCRPIVLPDGADDDDVEHYDITDGIDVTLTRETPVFDVEIHIGTYPRIDLDSDDWDMLYTFEGDGPAAPTAISVSRFGWTTVHSYPEYNTDVWTSTLLKPGPGDD